MPPQSRPPWPILAIPTVLSAVRIVLAVFFPMVERPARIGLVALAALSDGLDGFAARTLKSITWWGGSIDAFADKVFTIVVLVTLVLDNQLAVWQAALLLIRDAAIVLVVATLAIQRRWDTIKRITARVAGKITTLSLFSLLFVLLAWPHQIELALAIFTVAAALNVVAALDYLVLLRRPR